MLDFYITEIWKVSELHNSRI